MMEEQQELRLEVQRLIKLVEEVQKAGDETTPSMATTSFAKRFSQITRKRSQIITLTAPWVEWISYFKLCAEINHWNDAQCCQQLAVSLQDKAQ